MDKNLNIYNIYSYDSIMNFINRSWNFKRDISYLNKVDKRIYNSVNNFSLPSFEYGALEIVKNIFPKYKNLEFLKGTLRQNDVLEQDIKEVNIYAKNKPFNISDYDILIKTIKYIKDTIIDANVSMVLEESIKTLPSNTSTGFPEYTKKGSVLGIKNCLKRAKIVMSMDNFFEIYRYMRKFPTTIFHRFTPKVKVVKNVCNPSFKIRQIFGTSFFIVALEKMVFYNFVESYKRSFNSIYMIGKKKTEISKYISKLRDKAKFDNSLILCGDISGNDKSISKTHSTLFFNVAYNFVKTEFNDIFAALMIYYIRTPIIYSNGLIYSNGSTISGSWITSTFNTFCVTSAVYYSYYKIYDKFPSINEFLVMGDDFVILIKNEEDKFLFKQYMNEFNLRLRLDKSELVTPYQGIDFLGYTWDYNNTPDQEDLWFIGKILYPEKFVIFDSKYRILYRMISIFINSKRFRYFYNKLFIYDKYLREMIMYGIDSFVMFNLSNDTINVRIPFDLYLTLGWRML